jgi:hypothetical protein
MNSEAKNRTAERESALDLPGACSIRPGHTSRPLSTLESLKDRILAELLLPETNAELIRRLHRAADESASVAWASAFPMLLLPELLLEKSREAKRQFERQVAIQSRGRNVCSLAA